MLTAQGITAGKGNREPGSQVAHWPTHSGSSQSKHAAKAHACSSQTAASAVHKQHRKLQLLVVATALEPRPHRKQVVQLEGAMARQPLHITCDRAAIQGRTSVYSLNQGLVGFVVGCSTLTLTHSTCNRPLLHSCHRWSRQTACCVSASARAGLRRHWTTLMNGTCGTARTWCHWTGAGAWGLWGAVGYSLGFWAAAIHGSV